MNDYDRTVLGRIVRRAQFVKKLTEASGLLQQQGQKELAAMVAVARDVITMLPADVFDNLTDKQPDEGAQK